MICTVRTAAYFRTGKPEWEIGGRHQVYCRVDQARVREETEPTGIALTAAGRAAIGFEATEPAGDVTQANNIEDLSPSDAKPPRQTKAMLALALLEREEGATFDELIAATRAPAHPGAALTGLHEKDHAIDRSERGDITCYHAKTD